MSAETEHKHHFEPSADLQTALGHAEHLLRKVIQQWPTYVSPYYFLAIALDAQGRTEDAKQAVHTALNIYPKHTLERISLYLGAHPDPNEGKRRLELLASLWLHP